jgi:chemotaxis protein MotB
MSEERDESKRKSEPPAAAPRRGVLAPFLALTFLGTTCAVGWYARELYRKEHASAEAHTQASGDLGREQARVEKLENELAGCRREGEVHATGQAENKKVADDARAALDATQAELEQLRRGRADAEARLKAFQLVTARLQKMIDAGKLKVLVRDGRMIVKLPERILFPSGSAELGKDGGTAIREIASILRQFSDRRFMVAGHTDNVPAGGKYKSNWDLATARAVVVTEQLVSGGMNAAKLVAAGYGPYEPIATNGTEVGRAENRRIEIVLLPNIEELPPIPTAEPSASVAPSASPAAAPPTKAAGTRR